MLRSSSKQSVRSKHTHYTPSGWFWVTTVQQENSHLRLPRPNSIYSAFLVVWRASNVVAVGCDQCVVVSEYRPLSASKSQWQTKSGGRYAAETNHPNPNPENRHFCTNNAPFATESKHTTNVVSCLTISVISCVLNADCGPSVNQSIKVFLRWSK